MACIRAMSELIPMMAVGRVLSVDDVASYCYSRRWSHLGSRLRFANPQFARLWSNMLHEPGANLLHSCHLSHRCERVGRYRFDTAFPFRFSLLLSFYGNWRGVLVGLSHPIHCARPMPILNLLPQAGHLIFWLHPPSGPERNVVAVSQAGHLSFARFFHRRMESSPHQCCP